MLLATKNKIFVYNNTYERKLIEENLEENFKIFTDNDRDKAKTYAKTERICGFMTKEMNAFEILCELKLFGINVVIFCNEISSYDIFLNDIYILNTYNRLSFDIKTNRFKEDRFDGKDNEAEKDLYNRIKYYSEKTKKPMNKAISEYIKAMAIVFGVKPFTKINKSRFVSYSGYITFDNICKDIRIKKETEVFKINLIDRLKLQDYELSKIYGIKEKEISLEIKNKLFLNYLEKGE